MALFMVLRCAGAFRLWAAGRAPGEAWGSTFHLKPKSTEGDSTDVRFNRVRGIGAVSHVYASSPFK